MRRRFIITALCVCALMSSLAQEKAFENTPLEDIERGWKTKPIGNVINGSLGIMLERFDQTWPTWMVGEVRSAMEKGLSKVVLDEETALTVTVDSQNGYVEVSDGGTDGEYIYRVDHGDAFPRGISVTRAAVGGSVTDVDYCVPIVFDGQTGDNSTAVETGGFAVGERNLLIAWMHYNDDGTTSYYLLAVAKDLSDFKLIEVGGAAEGLTAFNPMLVPLENGNYLYMYEMYPPRQPVTDIICTIVDEDGNAAGEPLAVYGTSLSDCQPVYCPDGIVRWTVVEDGNVTLYSYDPLSEAPDYVPGDVNGNGKIDSADYAMCKRAFLRTYVLNDDQFTRADINKNSRLDAAEYAMIKRHFLKTYTIPGAAGK